MERKGKLNMQMCKFENGGIGKTPWNLPFKSWFLINYIKNRQKERRVTAPLTLLRSL
jgi:hypothetical protein